MAAPADDPSRELLQLARALSVQLDRLQASGATGLPPAVRERGAAVSTPAASVAPQPAPLTPTPNSAGGPPPLSPEERLSSLSVIAAEVSECVACRLHQRRTQTVFARGNGSSGLCFVGEGPGAEEDAQGLPFVGKAGQLLDKMIEAMGFSPADVYVANIVKCRPPDNRKPEPDEMKTCVGYLERQLELVRPQVIVALGATAATGLLGTTVGITRLRGQWKLYRGRVPVMPTFHPAYLLRQPAAKRDVWSDLRAVVEQMGRRLPEPKSR
ncbi:MAG: uracil-DNA glycosylase [Polyangiaceae bacterium]|nr:uracil-DNA glycosylase [Polyangiaceae bacterium]